MSNDKKGIVRRLDDLGRVVIPKEYRKMFKIELGDPLECFALETGEILIKKVDQTVELYNEAVPVIEILSKELKLSSAVCDRSTFIAVAGSPKAKVDGANLPAALASAINDRKAVVDGSIAVAESGFSTYAMYPIANETEVLGGLFVFADRPITDAEKSAAKITASVLGVSLKKY